MDEDGHIVTNNHVITDGDAYEVVFSDGQRSAASIMGTDIDSDLAVLKVETLPANTHFLPMGDSSSLQVGQFVIAIGNPFGENGSMSIGVISGLGRTIDSQREVEGGGHYSLPQVIQTDAAINPGNSGGPLLNLNGEVVGVNSSILTRTGTNSGVGFSIPVNAVKKVAPAIVAEGKYTYPFIGISMLSPLDFDIETQLELNLPSAGVIIREVQPGTPASEAGLIGGTGGDFITAINGFPIQDTNDLISYLVFESEVGQTIELTVLRNNEEIQRDRSCIQLL
ncbi:MAG: S1C family serine protease, partial [Anaerolineae bacterium]